MQPQGWMLSSESCGQTTLIVCWGDGGCDRMGQRVKTKEKEREKELRGNREARPHAQLPSFVVHEQNKALCCRPRAASMAAQ